MVVCIVGRMQAWLRETRVGTWGQDMAQVPPLIAPDLRASSFKLHNPTSNTASQPRDRSTNVGLLTSNYSKF